MNLNNVSQRDAFWNKVYETIKTNRDILIVSADMGAPSLDIIRKDFPSQFINVGIAEQNAITIATGLTLSGKKVFVYAIAPFIVLRCLEQIRVNCAIMNIPITIVGVGGGFGYSDSGPTHHLTEDIAILRAMPNIEINNITDSIMAEFFVDISCKSKNPNFIRLHRQNLPNIYSNHHNFAEGFCVLKEGKDYYIISTGVMTHTALRIANELDKEKIKIGVIDVYTFPIKIQLLELLKDVKKIITLEENFLPGGLGSAVIEMLIDNNMLKPLKRIGLSPNKGYCYKYGGLEVIYEYYGIGDVKVKNDIKTFLEA